MVYIKLFVDYLDAIEPLGDAERGRLFTALMEYARTGEAPQLGGNERFLFPMMKAQLDRDIAATDEAAERSRENGKKGGRPKKPAETQNNPPGFFKPRETHNKDKDKDEDKEEDKDKTDRRAREFDAFWAAYPKKVGKEAARKAFARITESSDVLIAAVEAQKRGEQWHWENGRFIPNPATWLNQGRWQDEVPGRAPKVYRGEDFFDG